MKKHFFWLALLLVIVIACGAAYILSISAEIPYAFAEHAKMVPTVSDAGGVDASSAFTLTLEGKVNAISVRKYLSVEPALDMEIHQGKSNREVLVVPAEPLAPDTLYRFVLEAEGQAIQWAFQTKGTLEVVESDPADQTVAVGLRSRIRLVFNTSGMAASSDWFSIEPAVAGHLETAGRMVSFIPDEPLAPNTIYTVTAKAGWPLSNSDLVLEEDYSFRFETAAAEGGSDATADWYLRVDTPAFPVGQLPAFAVEGGTTAPGQALQAQVYAYADGGDYAEALLYDMQNLPSWSQQAKRVSLANLSALRQVADFEAPLIEGADGYYLSLPNPVPAGFYLLDVQWQGVRRQIHFQVSDILAFVQPSGEQTLFWLHSGVSGQPLGDAAILELVGGMATRSSAEGLALMDAQDPSQDAIYIIEKEGASLVLPYAVGEIAQREPLAAAVSYLYSDREHYQQTDTIQYWGLLDLDHLAENADAQALNRLKVGLYGHLNPDVPIMEHALSATGATFSGSFDTMNFNSGAYSLRVTLDGATLYHSDFTVEEAASANYHLHVEAAEAAMRAGEPLSFAISLHDAADKPIADYPLQYVLWLGEEQRSGEAVTDREGQVHLTFATAKQQAAPEGEPGYYEAVLHILATMPNGESLQDTAQVAVVENDFLVRYESVFTGSAGNLRFYFHQSEPQADGSFWGAPAAGAQAQMRLFRLEWETREENGQTQYQENRVELLQTTLQADADGFAHFDFVLPSGKQHNCRYWLEILDATGAVLQSAYLYPWENNSGLDYQPALQMQKANAEDSVYHAGELYQALVENVRPDHTYLFYSYSSIGLDAVYSAVGAFQGIFNEYGSTGLQLSVVSFDGEAYRLGESETISGNSNYGALNVRLSMEKTVVEPGQQVTLQIRATDEKGNAVATQGHVRIATADSLQEGTNLRFVQSQGARDGLHALPAALASHNDLRLGLTITPAAQGITDLHSSSLYFSAFRTDSDGQATITVDLPNDAEEWEAQALLLQEKSDKKSLGQGQLRFSSYSPFYLETEISPTYFFHDRPTIRFAAQGSLANGQISYTVRLEGPTAIWEEELSAQAGETAEVNFGRMVSGRHKLILEAAAPNGATAKLVEYFMVVDHAFAENATDQTPMQEGLERTGEEMGDSLVIVSTPQRGALLQTLWRLANSTSPQLESRLAAMAAQDYLKGYAGADLSFSTIADSGDLRIYQQENGGLASLPTENASLSLSCLAASLGQGHFATEELANYFQGFLNASDPQNQALALAGLAALGQPVLNELNAAFELAQTPAERLYLLWGRVMAGDTQGAHQNFEAWLTDWADLDADSLAWAWMIIAACGDLNTMESWDMGAAAHPLETMLAATHALERLENPSASFSYTLDDQTNRVNLAPDKPDFRLLFHSEKMDQLRFSGVRGNLTLTTLYKTTPEQPQSASLATLTRRYTGSSQQGWLTVEVYYELDAALAAGYYVLEDCLPGGLRLLEGVGERGQPYLFTNAKGEDAQVLSCLLYKEDGQPLSGVLRYQARVVSSGSFQPQPCRIRQVGQSLPIAYTLGEELIIP